MMGSVCPAAFSDLPKILEIYSSARAFMQRSGNPDQWNASYPAEELLRSDIRKGQLYLWKEGADILAVFVYFLGAEPTYAHIHGGQWCKDGPYGVIHRIAVAAPGKGIAARCFDWAFAQCANLRIDTHRDNKPMQRALEKYGFQYCGIIYLANGSERLAFQKI